MSSRASTTADNGLDLAIIALGANQDSSVGNPALTLQAALEDLQLLSQRPLRISGFYRTAPQDCPPGSPEFINAVAVLEVPQTIAPLDLLQQLQALEQKYGRQRSAALPANAPRPLDLDLLALGDRQLALPQLQLPHPRLARRRFVLEPLAELLPDLRLPGLSVSVRQLLAELPKE